MSTTTSRFQFALKAMAVHFGLSLLVAALIAWLVFTVWYPYPFREMSGGTELFILLVSIDIICGPLLTFILTSPTKPRKELITDISLIVLFQLLALCYGIWNIWLARPIYLVNEGSKFHVVSRVGLDTKSIEYLASALKPQLFSGPLKVSLRDTTFAEQMNIDALVRAGKVKAQMPQLYISYNGTKGYQQASTIESLIKYLPHKKYDVEAISKAADITDITQLRFTHIIGQDYWIGILNLQGEIIGYMSSK